MTASETEFALKEVEWQSFNFARGVPVEVDKLLAAVQALVDDCREVGELRRRVDELEDVIHDLKQEAVDEDRLQEEIDNLEDEVGELEDKIANLEQEMASLTKQNERLQWELDNPPIGDRRD